jgi:hypothetical protein
LFPKLRQVAEAREARRLLEPLATDPPAWWVQFFTYLARTSLDKDAVRAIYDWRRASPRAPLTPEERSDYVERLQRDGAIAEAYIVWVSGLDDNARKRLGLIFDGGFDLPFESRGFGWRVSAHKNVSVTGSPTRGASDPAALRVRFAAFDGLFSHVSQPMFLDPGAYRVTGRVRMDSLTSKGGVRWAVRCVVPAAEVLGAGPRFVGSGDWAEFRFDFEVPETCGYQQLVLVSAGTRPFERKLDGVIWFDDLRVRRIAEIDAAARAEAELRDRGMSQ